MRLLTKLATTWHYACGVHGVFGGILLASRVSKAPSAWRAPDLVEGINYAVGLTVTLELGKVLQKQGQTRRHSPPKIGSKVAFQYKSERPPNHAASSTQICLGKAVNPRSEPWKYYQSYCNILIG